MAHLHGWPQQDVSALVSGHFGITRLPVVSNFYYYTATVEDVNLGHIRHKLDMLLLQQQQTVHKWNILIWRIIHLLQYASKPVISPIDPPK